jgi:hypothetical protein
MHRSRLFAQVITVAFGLCWLSALAATSAALPDSGTTVSDVGDDDDDEVTADSSRHVRFENRRIQDLVGKAEGESTTLRGLLATLDESDVVAYVRCDRRLRDGISGVLSFVSKVGDVRYVLIKVAYVGSRMPQVALVGHELRHAVEVSQLSGIVDGPSFHREYKRIGFVNEPASRQDIVAYETQDARRTGEQILRELRQGTD